MSYIEIKAIKAVAAVQRGVINTALYTLTLRARLADRKLRLKEKYAQELSDVAIRAKEKSATVLYQASDEFEYTSRELLAASNTVLNLRDDLNKITE